MGEFEAVDSLLRVSGDPGEIVVEVETDQELVGGAEEMTEQTVSVRHYEMTLAQSLTKPHTLAFLAASALGNVSSATTAVGAWLHTITPKAARDFDLFTVEELLQSGLQKQYADCFVDSLELSIERRRSWDITAQVLGAGKIQPGVASVSEVSESNIHTKFTRAWLSTGTYDNSTPANDTTTELTATADVIEAEIESLRWSYNNNTDQDFLWHLNSGVTWGRAERSERSQTISMTLLMTRTVALDRLIDGTALSLQIKAVNTAAQIASSGVYQGATVIWPQIEFTKAAPKGTSGSRMVWEIEANVHEHATYGSVRLYVWNAQTGYMA
jgi:hypothetical protein